MLKKKIKPVFLLTNKFEIKTKTKFCLKKKLKAFFLKKKRLKKHKTRLLSRIFSYTFKSKKLKYEQTLLFGFFKKKVALYLHPFLFNKLIFSKVFKYNLIKRLGNLW